MELSAITASTFPALSQPILGAAGSSSPPSSSNNRLQLKGRLTRASEVAPPISPQSAASDRVTFGQLSPAKRQALFDDPHLTVPENPDYIKGGVQMGLGVGLFVLGCSIKVASLGLLLLPALYIDQLGVAYAWRGWDTLNQPKLPAVKSRNEALALVANTPSSGGDDYRGLTEFQPKLEAMLARYKKQEPNSLKTELITTQLKLVNQALDMIEGDANDKDHPGGVSIKYPPKLRITKKDLSYLTGPKKEMNLIRVIKALASPINLLDSILFKDNRATVKDVLDHYHQKIDREIVRERRLKTADKELFRDEMDWNIGYGNLRRSSI